MITTPTKCYQEDINPSNLASMRKLLFVCMVVPYLAVVTRVQAQETEGKAIIENIIVLGDSILSLGELSDVEKIMKPFGFKDFGTIKGNPYYEQEIGEHKSVYCAMLLDSKTPSLICKTKFYAFKLYVKTLQSLLKKYGYTQSPTKKNLYSKGNRHIEVGKVAIDKEIDKNLFLITTGFDEADYVFYLSKSKGNRQ